MQAAEHLDRGGLAGAVGAEEAVDLAVAHLEIDTLHGLEATEALSEGPGADRDAAVGAGLVAVAGKVGDGHIALEVAQDRDERVLERGRRGAHLGHDEAGGAQGLADRPLSLADVAHHHVEAVAEPLNIGGSGVFREHRLRGAEIGGPNLEPLEPEAAAELGRRADPVDAPLVHEGDPVAPLGLVEVRRREEDRHALAREPDNGIPELPARDRIDPGGGLVQQKDARLGDQRAGQRQLLLHARRSAGRPADP